MEFTGYEEASGPQDDMKLKPGEEPRATGQPRRYYRLTEKGKAAPDWEWSNPLLTLYGDQFPPEYFREKRRAKRYG